MLFSPFSWRPLRSVGCSVRALLFSAAIAVQMPFAQAQSITAADDGTGTAVTQTDSHFAIEAGTHSPDGRQLFHSFDAFSLDASESATFFPDAAVQNILARVRGGAPSLLNGLLQVESAGGSMPNLFLMNPAGVLFGNGARLNLPGNLLVTTADAIGIGDQSWFSAVGQNNYAALIGEPNDTYAFLSAPPGSIVNSGNLSLASGTSLSLLGGSVVNTGSLSVPGGALTIVAVPGDRLVRVGRTDALLSLEFSEIAAEALLSESGLNQPERLPFSLPALLTHSKQEHATALTVRPDGTVQLSGALGTEPIQLWESRQSQAIVAGTLSVASDSSNASSEQGGEIIVVGNRIGVLNATLTADGLVGGNIRIGGDYQGNQNLPTAQQTVIASTATLSANARRNGDGGRVIVWADDLTRYAGSISARGGPEGGNGGFVEVSGKETLSFSGQVDVRAPNGEMGTVLLDPEDIVIVSGQGAPDDGELLDNTIGFEDVGEQFTLSEGTLESLSARANLSLSATNDIILRDLLDNRLSLKSGNSTVSLIADADSDGAGDVIFNDSSDRLIAPGRSLSITGTNLVLGTLNTSSLEVGGNVSLQASNSITTGNIRTFAQQEGGSVNLTANGDITTQSIRTASEQMAGDITATSETGNITTGSLLAGSLQENEGTITLSAPGEILVDGELWSGNSNSPPPSLPGNGNNSPPLPPPPPLPDDEDNLPPLPSPPLPPGNGDNPPPGDGDNFSPNKLPFDPNFLPPDMLRPPGGLAEGLDGSYNHGLAGSDMTLTLEGLLAEGRPGPRRGSQGSKEGITPDDLVAADSLLLNRLPVGALPQRIELSLIEANRVVTQVSDKNHQAYTSYLGLSIEDRATNLAGVQQMLKMVEQERQNRSAVVYINLADAEVAADNKAEHGHQSESNEAAQESDRAAIEIVVVTPDSAPSKVSISVSEKSVVLDVIKQFRSDLITSARRGGDYYLEASQQLYQQLIAPIEADLKAANIQTIAFEMGEGLRSLPIAALHSGEQFLIEQYSLGIVPSTGLVSDQFDTLQNAQVLAMGVSDFQQLAPLPAVPFEVELINDLWQGSTFINESFTRQNLVEQRLQSPYQVIHLATHAQFNPGPPSNSYIQLWDEKLRLDELEQLGWQYPVVDLLVLSACNTAVGSPEAEMGFAGLAVASGVRSAMASLWSIDDLGTLAFMGEFYDALSRTAVKADALRTAQLAMLQGDVSTETGQVQSRTSRGAFNLPSSLGDFQSVDFSHPYYWSGFTMIGSPW